VLRFFSHRLQTYLRYQKNHVYDEHTHTLQIYWSSRDVISWLAENSDDEHLKKVKKNAEQHALKMEVASRSVHDEKALFDEDDADDDEIVLGRPADNGNQDSETSRQRLLSMAKVKPEFEGLRSTSTGHKIQDIRELMSVPVRHPMIIISMCSGLTLPSGHRHG
jgi:protein SSD1